LPIQTGNKFKTACIKDSKIKEEKRRRNNVTTDIESYEGGQQIMFGKYYELVIKRIK